MYTTCTKSIPRERFSLSSDRLSQLTTPPQPDAMADVENAQVEAEVAAQTEEEVRQTSSWETV